jgi:choline kinase
MTYIFLIAGKGSRLHPLTLTYPKTLYKLNDDITVIERMIHLIKKYDSNAKIVAVTGFMHKKIESLIDDNNVTFVYNPFFEVTNSIASLWFAKDYLMDDDGVVLINGDIVMDESLVKDIVCSKPEKPTVLLDSSIKKDGDYNVQVNGNKVVVMSKGLDEYTGEYAGIVRLDKNTLKDYYKELEQMIEDGLYDQWYEDVIVQMIFKNNYNVYFEDVANYDWTEIDCVSDLVFAKKIQNK